MIQANRSLNFAYRRRNGAVHVKVQASLHEKEDKMEHKEFERTLERTKALNGKMDDKLVKSLELDLLERIIGRLHSFDCAACTEFLSELNTHIAYFEQHDDPEKQQVKEYRKTIADIKAHLQKEHNLVLEGFYMSIFMSVGMSIGLTLGLTLFDNLALGLPIGMSIGLAVGVGLDADMKKKGRTI